MKNQNQVGSIEDPLFYILRVKGVSKVLRQAKSSFLVTFLNHNPIPNLSEELLKEAEEMEHNGYSRSDIIEYIQFMFIYDKKVLGEFSKGAFINDDDKNAWIIVVLYMYIEFISTIERSYEVEDIPLVFTCFALSLSSPFQSIVEKAFLHLLSHYYRIRNFSGFSAVLAAIYPIFYNESLLSHEFLEMMNNMSKYLGSDIEGKMKFAEFVSFLSVVINYTKGGFVQSASTKLSKSIIPKSQRLIVCSFDFFANMIRYLNPDQSSDFAKNVAELFCQWICSLDWTLDIPQNCYNIPKSSVMSESYQISYTFPSNDQQIKMGCLDGLEKLPKIMLPNEICLNDVRAQVKIISKALVINKGIAAVFLLHFHNFVNNSIDSNHYFELYSALLTLCQQIILFSHNQIEVSKYLMSEYVFNPHIICKQSDPLTKTISTLRAEAFKIIMTQGRKTMKILLLYSKDFPMFFIELMYRLADNIDVLLEQIHRIGSIVSTIAKTLVFFKNQRINMNHSFDPCTLAIIRFLDLSFANPLLIKEFFYHGYFVMGYLTFLFEPTLFKDVLSKIRIYIGLNPDYQKDEIGPSLKSIINITMHSSSSDEIVLFVHNIMRFIIETISELPNSYPLTHCVFSSIFDGVNSSKNKTLSVSVMDMILEYISVAPGVNKYLATPINTMMTMISVLYSQESLIHLEIKLLEIASGIKGVTYESAFIIQNQMIFELLWRLISDYSKMNDFCKMIDRLCVYSKENIIIIKQISIQEEILFLVESKKCPEYSSQFIKTFLFISDVFDILKENDYYSPILNDYYTKGIFPFYTILNDLSDEYFVKPHITDTVASNINNLIVSNSISSLIFFKIQKLKDVNQMLLTISSPDFILFSISVVGEFLNLVSNGQKTILIPIHVNPCVSNWSILLFELISLNNTFNLSLSLNHQNSIVLEIPSYQCKIEQLSFCIDCSNSSSIKIGPYYIFREIRDHWIHEMSMITIFRYLMDDSVRSTLLCSILIQYLNYSKMPFHSIPYIRLEWNPIIFPSMIRQIEYFSSIIVNSNCFYRYINAPNLILEECDSHSYQVQRQEISSFITLIREYKYSVSDILLVIGLFSICQDPAFQICILALIRDMLLLSSEIFVHIAEFDMIIDPIIKSSRSLNPQISSMANNIIIHIKKYGKLQNLSIRRQIQTILKSTHLFSKLGFGVENLSNNKIECTPFLSLIYQFSYYGSNKGVSIDIHKALKSISKIPASYFWSILLSYKLKDKYFETLVASLLNTNSEHWYELIASADLFGGCYNIEIRGFRIIILNSLLTLIENNSIQLTHHSMVMFRQISQWCLFFHPANEGSFSLLSLFVKSPYYSNDSLSSFSESVYPRFPTEEFSQQFLVPNMFGLRVDEYGFWKDSQTALRVAKVLKKYKDYCKFLFFIYYFLISQMPSEVTSQLSDFELSESHLEELQIIIDVICQKLDGLVLLCPIMKYRKGYSNPFANNYFEDSLKEMVIPYEINLLRLLSEINDQSRFFSNLNNVFFTITTHGYYSKQAANAIKCLLAITNYDPYFLNIFAWFLLSNQNSKQYPKPFLTFSKRLSSNSMPFLIRYKKKENNLRLLKQFPNKDLMNKPIRAIFHQYSNESDCMIFFIYNQLVILNFNHEIIWESTITQIISVIPSFRYIFFMKTDGKHCCLEIKELNDDQLIMEIFYHGKSKQDVVSNMIEKAQKDWLNYNMATFDYIYLLNLLSGRFPFQNISPLFPNPFKGVNSYDSYKAFSINNIDINEHVDFLAYIATDYCDNVKQSSKLIKPSDVSYQLHKGIESDHVSQSINLWIDCVWGINIASQFKDVHTQLFNKPHPMRDFRPVNQIFRTLAVLKSIIENIMYSFVFFTTNDEIYIMLISSDNIIHDVFVSCINERYRFISDGAVNGEKIPFSNGSQVIKSINERYLFVKSEKLLLFDTNTLDMTLFSESPIHIESDSSLVALLFQDGSLITFLKNSLDSPLNTVFLDLNVGKCFAVSYQNGIGVVSSQTDEICVFSIQNGLPISKFSLKSYYPEKILITPRWNYVLILGRNKFGNERLFVYTTNGFHVRAYGVKGVTSLCSWTSTSGFDCLGIGTNKGDIYYGEVYTLDMMKSTQSAKSPIVTLTYQENHKRLVIVAENGIIMFLPV